MLVLSGKPFVTILHVLITIEEKSRKLTGDLKPEAIINLKQAADEIIVQLAAMDLPVSKKTVQEMMLGAKTHAALNAAIKAVYQNIALEMDGRKFFGPERRFEQYYEQAMLFGAPVFAAFPSANNDITEAGNCLALERGTACVMHLMRVVEVGLKSLASALSVGQQGDWGGYLREIDKALEARIKAAGKRTPDEQFYAEVRVTIDGVRMAWRNPTMHIDNSYSLERAEQIFTAVRGLMQHLATKLHDP